MNKEKRREMSSYRISHLDGIWMRETSKGKEERQTETEREREEKERIWTFEKFQWLDFSQMSSHLKSFLFSLNVSSFLLQESWNGTYTNGFFTPIQMGLDQERERERGRRRRGWEREEERKKSWVWEEEDQVLFIHSHMHREMNGRKICHWVSCFFRLKFCIFLNSQSSKKKKKSESWGRKECDPIDWKNLVTFSLSVSLPLFSLSLSSTHTHTHTLIHPPLNYHRPEAGIKVTYFYAFDWMHFAFQILK